MNENIIIYLLAYLIASIPFGLLIGKFFAGVDITSQGSGSIGATNVLRVLKQTDPKKAKKLAILTVVCDILKGLIPLVVAKVAGVDANVLWSMAVLAVLGHCFSPFLKFEGGKGVATGVGVLAFFLPLEAVIAVIVWFVAGKAIKISSLASLLGLFTLVIASFLIHPNIAGINTHAPILIIAIIVVYKHIPNIKRLFEGKEAKVI
ncbi:glycerol-3-phosphate 1-O-acyltransferase PlsY [Campylobacter geochelonis]|uniref:Glycerol-3-phosphate acyltransferase n=1 Tax=Campylobacter geochelonis TaxID=1780362 RepID=A0A128EMV1_9BACT|nr:glycerol-3-phosphate 1-O-acyltransferase PlsY [Campylobacter geochelonis]QKF70646.1 acyl phosphate:glycerol-3-phosphate acyltransferase [Campylobacter geochelonis]CZE45867.1 glycerol-3-phosphate acyltransferase PlsY [Campylobacter geochelonis]CZE46770.1 glycerol-3-phosphate acyltransferase PlsY [Campylobacter geochelonis]CZE50312.1 glycerol-3-phosphate acyltransferase PlsY [Campylobacter geochelonis]